MDAFWDSTIDNIRDFTVHTVTSPLNMAIVLFLVPALTVGLSYLAAYILSPLNKFPGPSLAC